MKVSPKCEDEEIWEALKKGLLLPKKTANGIERTKPKEEWIGNDKTRVRYNNKAMHILVCCS